MTVDLWGARLKYYSRDEISEKIKNMTQEYDSTPDTLKHIRDVQDELQKFAGQLYHRGLNHDYSKLKDPEKELFDKYTPILRESEYGSKEYLENLKLLKPALDHHYANNSHHPEHYKNGVDGMNLLDLVEMFCDWKAAVKRIKNGDIHKSLEINTPRFNMSEQLYNIFKNSI